MKILFTMFGLFFCMTSLRAQTDQLLIDVRGDTVVVQDKNAYENCAARFQIVTTVQGNDVTIVESDTIAAKAFCDCVFNLYAYLTGLQPGAYSVTVYRQYWKKYMYPEDKRTLIGNASFAIVQPQPGAQYARSVQSECLGNEVPVSGAPVSNDFSLSVYPNPAFADVRVRVTLARAERITLLLFDEQGNEAGKPLEFDAEPGAREFTFPISRFAHSGTYYCAVVTSSAVKMMALTIIR